MPKQYFRKDDLSNPDSWVKMSGKEFYQFVRDPQNQGRYFIDMGDVVLECTEAEYKQFKAEDDHSSYILEQEAGLTTLSLESPALEDGLHIEEFIADITQDVEAEAVQRIETAALFIALSQLKAKDYRLIYALYLADDIKTEREVAQLNAVSQNAIHKRKKKILKILKSEVVKISKSSQ